MFRYLVIYIIWFSLALLRRQLVTNHFYIIRAINVWN